MSNFRLEIVTPHEVAFDEDVNMIIVRTTEGNLGILANHAPLVTELVIGEMKIKEESGERNYFIAGGFLEVSENKVRILADKAMKAEEIDLAKEKEEIEKIQAKLRKISEDKDIALTQRALQESLMKVKIGEKIR